jgi:hypothetical protein
LIRTLEHLADTEGDIPTLEEDKKSDTLTPKVSQKSPKRSARTNSTEICFIAMFNEHLFDLEENFQSLFLLDTSLCNNVLSVTCSRDTIIPDDKNYYETFFNPLYAKFISQYLSPFSIVFFIQGT